MQVKTYITSQCPLMIRLYREIEKDEFTIAEDMTQEYLVAPIFSPEIEKFLSHIENETLWYKYMQGCLVTWNQTYMPYVQVSNAVHGIIGELGEVIELLIEHSPKDLTMDELGDLLYYRTMFCLLLGLDLDLRQTEENQYSTWKSIAELSDVGKKVAFHDKFDNEKIYKRAIYGIGIIDTFIKDTLVIINAEVDDVMQLNLAKLANRHNKGKFNPNY